MGMARFQRGCYDKFERVPYPNPFLEASMGKMLRKLSLLIALPLYFLLTLSPAWADGNKLLEGCQNAERILDDQGKDLAPNQITSAHFCAGIVQGVGTTYFTLGPSLPQGQKPCFPAGGIKNEQGVRIVLKFLRDNPNILDINESLVALAAFKAAFQCK
jgi:hypothetical protein